MEKKETFTKVPRPIALVFTVMLMGFVAAGCEGVPATLSPAVSSTSATQIAQAPSPTSTASPTKIAAPTPIPTKTPTPQPTATPTKEPTPTPEPEGPVEMVATGNVDLYLSPDGEKVGYFVPGQRFTPTGVEQDGWIQVIDSDGNRLWIQEGGLYGPVGEEPEVSPTPEPTQEIVPSNEICAVGELEGICYQRTPSGDWRSGVYQGRPFPDGSVRHFARDPDINLAGKWMIGGRVEKIDLSQNLIYFKGRGSDIIKIKIDYNSPYFYARMRRPDYIGPWRGGVPEVRPILGRDIIVGDYLDINMSGPGVEIKNWKTFDENYQAFMDAQKRGLIHPGVIIEMHQ